MPNDRHCLVVIGHLCIAHTTLLNVFQVYQYIKYQLVLFIVSKLLTLFLHSNKLVIGIHRTVTVSHAQQTLYVYCSVSSTGELFTRICVPHDHRIRFKRLWIIYWNFADCSRHWRWFIFNLDIFFLIHTSSIIHSRSSFDGL